jgi:hypothetical protein
MGPEDAKTLEPQYEEAATTYQAPEVACRVPRQYRRRKSSRYRSCLYRCFVCHTEQSEGRPDRDSQHGSLLLERSLERRRSQDRDGQTIQASETPFWAVRRSGPSKVLPFAVTVKRDSFYMECFVYKDSRFQKLGQSPLMARGWVLQERLLSRRSLYFGAHTFWECSEQLGSEAFPRDILEVRGGGGPSVLAPCSDLVIETVKTSAIMGIAPVHIYCTIVGRKLSRCLPSAA